MPQYQKSPHNSPEILKKKIYSKPMLTVLGKVSALTTGGSQLHQETGGPTGNGAFPDGTPGGNNGTSRS